MDWQRTAARTVYTEGGSAPPAGGLYLAFTSLAVHKAATEGQSHGTHAAAAAVAIAAHDVLVEYFPGSTTKLAADRAASLAMVPDGKKEAAGVSIGAAAADRMIASRVNDGRNASIVYSKPQAPGIWQPPASGMAFPGSVSSSRSWTSHPWHSTAPTRLPARLTPTITTRCVGSARSTRR